MMFPIVPGLISASVRYIATPVLALALWLTLPGCADSNQPTTRSSADQRQQQALQDPMGYGGNTDKVDISGGDLKTLDKKAMKHDLDSFFNP